MSFSKEVKEELLGSIGSSRHCQLAELAAIFQFSGFMHQETDGLFVCGIVTEQKSMAIKFFTLLKKTFNIYSDVLVRRHSAQSKGYVYVIEIKHPHWVKEFMMALKLYHEATHTIYDMSLGVDEVLLKKDCCRRAYIRGAYLAIGSMSDPEKGYHLEFVCEKPLQASYIQDVLRRFGIDAKIILRKKYHVVYIKEGEAIVDVLNLMGAHKALMELENTRIVKDVRNSINRRVNCETANIAKTISAATKQVEDIIFLRDNYGLEKLPDNLLQMARLRLEYQDASLIELANLSEPPIGKSGVNHRLRKLSELAERLR